MKTSKHSLRFSHPTAKRWFRANKTRAFHPPASSSSSSSSQSVRNAQDMNIISPPPNPPSPLTPRYAHHIGRHHRTHPTQCAIDTHDIPHIVCIALNTCIFQACTTFYQQTRGAGIGFQLSPALCNVAIALIEHSWAELQHNLTPRPAARGFVFPGLFHEHI